jgi:hypothetical protein
MKAVFSTPVKKRQPRPSFLPKRPFMAPLLKGIAPLEKTFNRK